MHAVFDGVVVEAVDGVAERQWLRGVRASWLAVKNSVVFTRQGWMIRHGWSATT